MFNSNLFPVKNYKIRVNTIFNIKVCFPLDPANPLYCILKWYIDETYVSGKLGPEGEHTSKLKMVMTLVLAHLSRRLKIIMRYKCIGYNLNVMRQSACLVINPITVDGYATLFNCTPVDRASDCMMAST